MAKGIRSVWVDSDTPEAIGNKVFKDGVEIADIPNGVQEYKDPDVVVNREYKYVIQSYTATSQSTDEVLGDNLNYYTIVEVTPPTGITPIMTNFRVENDTPDRVYFSTPLGYPDGMDKTGFVVSGNNISSVTKVDDNGGYFTVTSDFNFWDNNHIKLDGGNVTVYDFTYEHIVNEINEPTATTQTLYVTHTASGGNGTEGSPYTLIEAIANASAGTTIWVKAGDYGNYRPDGVSSKQGTAANPIILKGYTSEIRDLDNDWMVDYFVYGSNSEARAWMDPTKYPVFDGENDFIDDDNYDSLFYWSNSPYWIVKNLQAAGYVDTYRNTGGSNYLVMENCYSHDSWAVGTQQGKGFRISSSVTNQRLYRCISSDSALNCYSFDGSYNLLEECESHSGTWASHSTDYAIVGIGNFYNIWKNNEVYAHGNLGHGIGIKGQYNGTTQVGENAYNLFDGNKTYGGGETNYFAWPNTHHNVCKNSFTEGADVGLRARSGAHDNIYENNYLTNGTYAISMTANIEGQNPGNTPVPDPLVGIAWNNVYRNNIFKNFGHGITSSNTSERQEYDLFNNEIINNTFYNIGDFFYDTATTDGGGVNYDINYYDNWLRGNIVVDCPEILRTYATDADYNHENGSWFDCEYVPSGTGQDATNPLFNNTTDFIPTVAFSSIDVPKINGSNYDYNKDERDSTTTRGAVKHNDEV